MSSTTPFCLILLFALHMAAFTMGGPLTKKGPLYEEHIDKTLLGQAEDFIGKVKRDIIAVYQAACAESDIQTTPAIEVDMELVEKMKKAELKKQMCSEGKPSDCAEVMICGRNESGVYTIWPKINVTGEKLDVFCDMDTDGGGWTVIQRRGDYGHPEDYFYRDWASYKSGFGDIREDFWLGNDAIFALTNQKDTSVRFDLRDSEAENKYAHYEHFRIENEAELYKLHIRDHSGSAQNSMAHYNNQPFTTKDRDHDRKGEKNCAEANKGAWWYKRCGNTNLNGLYYRGSRTEKSVNWFMFGTYNCLSFTEIKVRPSDFKDFN